MMLSVVIPARDEAGSIAATVSETIECLERAGIEHEVLVIDDASGDDTAAVVEALAAEHPAISVHRSHHPNGFGFAVRAGLERFRGDAVAVMMADGSDDPADLVRYHTLLEQGYDCAFGSRFMAGSRVEGYPPVKLAVNRLANWFVRALFRLGYNDTTNAFKAYRREVIETVQPLFSNHFNLTVELPLKAFARGHSFAVIPISWRNRSAGQSKLGMQEMGGRYLFIVLYVFLERHLSRGDYYRRSRTVTQPSR
ncbi:MAG: glycosyltransferase [Solirubrobacterales bacterium]|nr:glycosyltransferase [Solirubrobacterales bacterium]